MIEISQLTAGYGVKTIISRLSFTADPAHSPVVLAGRNGSGKSTFLKALLGEIPFAGELKISPPNSGIGWLPQQFHLALRMPVADFVKLGSVEKKGLFPSFAYGAEQLVSEALAELEIGHLADSYTDALSGGEWQLVCLAQLLVQKTDIWLLDEPTASLDVYYKSLVFNFLWKKAGMGKTIILATHDLPFLPIYSGSLLSFPNPTQLKPLNEESLQEVLKLLQSK